MSAIMYAQDVPIIPPQKKLPDNDEVPLESPWHRSAMNLLIDQVNWQRRDRTDYFVGGNMFVYYSSKQPDKMEFRGPDFFFVDGVDGTRPRRYWHLIDEDGKYPDTILELLSDSTAKNDLTTKKDVYEQTFRTPEYFCYDPADGSLLGWRLKNLRYEPIQPDAHGRLWSEMLGLWLGTWDGEFQRISATWPRWYDADGNLVETAAEAAQREAQEAQREAHEAQREAQEAQRDAQKSQRDAQEAQRDAQKSQRDAQKSQRDAQKSQRDAEEAQREAQEAQREAQAAQKKLDRIQAWLTQQGLNPPANGGPPS